MSVLAEGDKIVRLIQEKETKSTFFSQLLFYDIGRVPDFFFFNLRVLHDSSLKKKYVLNGNSWTGQIEMLKT